MLDKMWSVFTTNSDMFLAGTLTTLKISLFGTLVGLIIGLAVGIVRTIPKQKGWKQVILEIVKKILAFYILFFRGTPMMVQAMILYYGLPSVGIDMASKTAAYLIVSINTGAYMSEIVRGGILAIDEGQFEAAKASGFSHFQTMLYVVLPQAIRNILPATGNEFIINVKDTSVLNVISLNELFFTTTSIAGSNYDYVTPFAITCLIYLFLTTVISTILRKIEEYMDGPENYEMRTPGHTGNQMQV